MPTALYAAVSVSLLPNPHTKTPEGSFEPEPTAPEEPEKLSDSRFNRTLCIPSESSESRPPVRTILVLVRVAPRMCARIAGFIVFGLRGAMPQLTNPLALPYIPHSCSHLVPLVCPYKNRGCVYTPTRNLLRPCQRGWGGYKNEKRNGGQARNGMISSPVRPHRQLSWMNHLIANRVLSRAQPHALQI
eukprot:717993-Hanusia_phi.AAC.12